METTPGLVGGSPDSVRAGSARWAHVWRRPSGVFALLVCALLLACTLFAPALAPYDPAAQDIARRLQGPSWENLLGTDHLGRDLLSRLIFGARTAFVVAVPAVLIAAVVGGLLGLVSGYRGGKIDSLVVLMVDSLQAFPALILTLVIIALLGPSLVNLVVVISIAFIPSYARVVRAEVLGVRQSLYVRAAWALGASDVRVIARHVMPNVLPPMLVLLAMDLPSAITLEAGLSFLGLGVQPPESSWGLILADGFSRVRDTPWPVLWAGLALMLTTLACSLLGERLRDALDPRTARALR